MALIGGLLAAAGRFLGKLANMALGWASVLLFGRVPQHKQSLLTLITVGSIGWVVTLVGIVSPDVGTLLIAAIPRPAFIDEGLVRLAMLGVVLVLPIVIGVLVVLILDTDRRPTGKGLVGQVLRGYLYAPVLAITLVALVGIAILRKLQALARRWEDSHVAVIVKPGGYERVVRDAERALADAGIDVRRTPAPKALTVPPRLLAAVGGAAVADLVPDELVSLAARGLSILVYPSDLAFQGEKPVVARARAAVVARLTETEAYLTSSAETQAIEDRLAGMARSGMADPALFREIDETLARLTVPPEDWEILYRLRLQVENELRLPDASQPATGAPATQAWAEMSGPAMPEPEGSGPGTSHPRRRVALARVSWPLAVLFLFVAAIAVRLGSQRRGEPGSGPFQPA
jgi:hypothetical protein